jgi:hypothetical protein
MVLRLEVLGKGLTNPHGKSTILRNITQDRTLWQASVNTVMKGRVHESRGTSSLAEWLLACQERLCSMELIRYTVRGCIQKFSDRVITK